MVDKSLLNVYLPDEEEIVDQIDTDMDNWWDALTLEDKEKAFYSVVKRLVQGELKDNGSYRHVLYSTFGFDSSSYQLGLLCGFMELHNSIVEPDTFSKMTAALRREQERNKELQEWFRVKSVCNLCGYQSMEIYPEQNCMCPMNDCEGGMVELKD